MVKEFPIISVVTLIYNNEKFTIESLECVNKQSYPADKIDHIIINDCSPGDDTAIREWIKKNRHSCRYYKHENNMGICASLNHFLTLARGEYWCGISDDLFGDDFIKRRVAFMKRQPSNVGMCFSPTNRLIGSMVDIHPLYEKLPNEITFPMLLINNQIPANTVFIRTSVYKNISYYNVNLYVEDFDMWLRISKKYRIILFDKIDTCYRIREKSVSHTMPKKVFYQTRLNVYYSHLKDDMYSDLVAERLHLHARKLTKINRKIGIKWLYKALIAKFEVRSLMYILIYSTTIHKYYDMFRLNKSKN